MEKFEWIVVIVILLCIGGIGYITGFIVGDAGGCSYDSCPRYVTTEVKEVDVTNLTWCLEQVQDVDVFQKELYDKEWLQ